MNNIFNKMHVKLFIAVLLILFLCSVLSIKTYAVGSEPVAGFGKALNFEVNRRIDIPYNDSTKIAGNSDFTVSMWIFPEGQIGCKTLYRQQGAESGSLGAWLRYEYDEADNCAYLYVMFNKLGTGWQLSWPWGSAVPPDVIKFPINQWTHVVLTKSGINIKTYINGVQSHGFNLDDERFGTPASVSGAIGVGGDFVVGENNYFDGCIDEVQFWNTALSQDEINDWMYREIDSTHPKHDNLVYYYKLNQTGGSEIIDSKGANSGDAVNIIESNWVDSDIRRWSCEAGTTITGYLIGSDIDGSSTNGSDWNLSFGIVTQGSKGTATVTGDNVFTYSTPFKMEGVDSFQYKVSDSDGNNSNIQTVYIDIIPAKIIAGNAGVAGAVLNYQETTAEGGTRIVTADENGEYSFKVPYNWSGKVTPRKAGYLFTPSSISYNNVLTDQTGQNYTTTITYAIAPFSNQSMTTLKAGYGAGTQEIITIPINKTGAGDLVNLKTELSGTDAEAFEITQPLDTTLNAETVATTFTIKAKDGLLEGTYTATVAISANSLVTKTFTVTQKVITGELSNQNLNYVDLNNWTKHRAGNWVVEAGGRTVRQTENSFAGFFLSPDTYINKIITGTIKVNTNSDDDLIGFVSGFQAPTDEDGNGENYYDFVLFDWKQGYQDGYFNVFNKAAEEGFTLARLTGELTGTEFYGGLGGWSKYFWFHAPEEGKFNILGTKYGAGNGWVDYKEYIFKILYTRDRIKILIDNDIVFDVEEENSFKEGKFGFYNASQEQVIYGNVRSVEIIPGAIKPVAHDDRYGATKNTKLEVDRFSGILYNDYDPNLDLYNIVIVEEPTKGTLNLDLSAGGFDYTPNDNVTGNDSFKYKLVETVGGEESDTATVFINIIEGENHDPADIIITNKLLGESWVNGTVVGTLSTVDVDVGDFHDLMLIDNAGGRFGINGNQIIINNSSLINFGEVHNIKVRTTDFRGLSFEKVFSIEAPNKVVFKDYNGTILKTEYVGDGDSATAPSTSAREGYTFSSWDVGFTNITDNLIVTAQYVANNNTVYKVEHYRQTIGGSDYNLLETDVLSGTTDTLIEAIPKVYPGFTENISHHDRLASGVILGNGTLVLKAYYDRNTYKVSFNTNGGNEIDDITNIRYEDRIAAPSEPTKENYIFLEWYKEVELINPWDFDTDKVIDDTTLYAKWIPCTYTIEDVEGQNFSILEADYVTGTQETKIVTISKTGTGNLTDLAVALSGENSDAFIVSQPEKTTLDNITQSTTFTIKAKNSLAAGIYTATVTISATYMENQTFTVTQGIKPRAPVMNSAVAGDVQVNISWNPTAGATGYKLYKSTTTGEYGAEYTTVESSVHSYDITELTNGTTYYFIVKATNPGGDSPASNEVSATPHVPAPGAPVMNSAVAGDGQVNLSWNPTAGATGYKIYKSTATGMYEFECATVSNSVYSQDITDLINGTTYYFIVKATNPGGDSPASNEVSATPQVPAPGAPVMNSAVAGDGQVNLSWNPTAGATGYKIYKSTATGMYELECATVSNSVYSQDITGLINGTTYYFIVKATNPGGDSPASNEVSATPQVPAPGAPVINSAIAGDGHVNISWNPTAGATGYKIYKSTATGMYEFECATVSNSVYSQDITGLINGTTYYFIVKAINPGGDSPASNEVSATPQVPAPGAPVINSAVAGDGQVNISWDPTAGATGYKIYKSATTGVYGAEYTTVASSVYSQNITELTNGTTYYFIVKATNPGGDSPASNEVSAIPKNVPGSPTNVTAVAGNGKAIVSFIEPTDNGGSPIIGYVVTSNPGNITATGTGATITITGLTNGITYTFSVKAVNEIGCSENSEASNAVTPYHVPDEGDVDDSPKLPSDQTPEPTKPGDGIEIHINGKPIIAATQSTTTIDNKTVTTVTLNDEIVEQQLLQESNQSVVTISVEDETSDVVGKLNGQMVKHMEEKDAILEIKTGSVIYTLPASQINIDDVLNQIGAQNELKDISVNIHISTPSQDTAEIIENIAEKNNYQIVIKPIEFEISCTIGEKTINISKFNAYVERLVEIPDGIDPDKITTGIILNNDGTFSHVPTVITVIDGKYYAKMNSLTNSIYSVINNPIEFADVANHWSKDAVNDMGSRLVIKSVKGDCIEPDEYITRGEFAEIVVRALGLMRPGTGKDVFSDVAKGTYFYDAVSIAYDHGILFGYGNGMFGYSDIITREQAITIVARASVITGLKTELKTDEIEKLFAEFIDSGESSNYAKNSIAVCIKAGIVSGRNGKALALKESLTRSEAAVLVRRLLQKANLI